MGSPRSPSRRRMRIEIGWFVRSRSRIRQIRQHCSKQLSSRMQTTSKSRSSTHAILDLFRFEFCVIFQFRSYPQPPIFHDMIDNKYDRLFMQGLSAYLFYLLHCIRFSSRRSYYFDLLCNIAQDIFMQIVNFRWIFPQTSYVVKR